MGRRGASTSQRAPSGRCQTESTLEVVCALLIAVWSKSRAKARCPHTWSCLRDSVRHYQHSRGGTFAPSPRQRPPHVVAVPARPCHRQPRTPHRRWAQRRCSHTQRPESTAPLSLLGRQPSWRQRWQRPNGRAAASWASWARWSKRVQLPSATAAASWASCILRRRHTKPSCVSSQKPTAMLLTFPSVWSRPRRRVRMQRVAVASLQHGQRCSRWRAPLPKRATAV
mmetsp:Transcript_87229/g.241937  ORF Transcript_87229/g.241937 Transcript_87229/m.241937 type:complete len:226 (-) Transcript_87229:581-1258(-)